MSKAEEEGFNAYVRQHYRECIKEAVTLVDDAGLMLVKHEDSLLVQAVFDKLASPKVYLVERWHNLSYDERMSYYPDREKLKEEILTTQAKGKEMLK